MGGIEGAGGLVGGREGGCGGRDGDGAKGGAGGLGGGPRGLSVAVTQIPKVPSTMRFTNSLAEDLKRIKSLDGEDANALSVTRETSPKPTAMSLMPAFLAAVAAAMAVLSSPPTVCTPSEIKTMTLGTPERAPVPVKTACPWTIPPERYVCPPIAGALSSAVSMVLSEGVSATCVTTVVSNSTYAI